MVHDQAPFDLDRPGEPLLTLPPLRGARSTLSAVLAERRRQIHQFGHTPAADDARDLWDLTKTAGRFVHRMNETASLHRIEGTRRDAVQLAAYALAVAESCDRRLQHRAASAALPI